MKTSELDYTLPEVLIAQHPCERRDESRLLVLNRADHSFATDVFRILPRYLHHGDCLALNDTRVIRARLRARKTTGGQIEVFLLHENAPANGRLRAAIIPSKARTAGGISPRHRCTSANGFPGPPARSFAARRAVSPRKGRRSPSVIHRDKPTRRTLRAQPSSECAGAVAAPTADSTSPRLCFAISGTGVGAIPQLQSIRHVSAYKPKTREHALEPEQFTLDEACANTLTNARERGGRIVGVANGRGSRNQFRTAHFSQGPVKPAITFIPPMNSTP